MKESSLLMIYVVIVINSYGLILQYLMKMELSNVLLNMMVYNTLSQLTSGEMNIHIHKLDLKHCNDTIIEKTIIVKIMELY